MKNASHLWHWIHHLESPKSYALPKVYLECCTGVSSGQHKDGAVMLNVTVQLSYGGVSSACYDIRLFLFQSNWIHHSISSAYVVLEFLLHQCSWIQMRTSQVKTFTKVSDNDVSLDMLTDGIAPHKGWTQKGGLGFSSPEPPPASNCHIFDHLERWISALWKDQRVSDAILRTFYYS